MSILLAFAPLLLSIILAIAWIVMAFVVGVVWAVNRFKRGRIVNGIALLLCLIVLPLGAWLLGHRFFHSELFSSEENQKPSTTLDNIGFVLESMENLVGGEKAPDGEPAASNDGTGAQTDGRAPEEYSDEELLALAAENFDEMFSLTIYYMNCGPLAVDFPYDVIRIEYEGPEGETLQRSYVRVSGYNTLADAQAAAAEVWYSKFAHKYYPDPSGMYIYFNGGVYTPDGGVGGPGAVFVVDSIVSREGDEVVFSGHWESDGELYGDGDVKFSFVFEDDRWKYGKYGL